MGKYIKGITIMIKKMVMENFFGLMEKYIKVIGNMGNKMVKGSFLMLKKINGKKDFGLMEGELDGKLKNNILKVFIIFISLGAN
jgi:hypothetical protein